MISEILQARLTDYVFIRVPSRLNDRIGSFHLSLSPKVLDDGTLPEDEISDKPFNEELHTRTSAPVIAVPSTLSSKVLYEKYQGTPRYSPYIDHETINDAVKRMPPDLAKDYGRNMYNPGNPVESYQEQPNIPEIQQGDTIYFEYNVLLRDDAYVDTDKHGEVYRVPYQSIYCYVRNGKINMINGWVFVESVTIEKVSKYIILINNKPQHNVGKIAHCGKWLDYFRPYPGDICLFLRTLFTTKNWDSTANEHEVSGYDVEGKFYYPMKQKDIVAVQEDGWQTVGDYVTIVPETINRIGSVETIQNKPGVHQPFKPGQIFIPEGSNVQEKKKKIHNFGIGMCDGKRVAYGKSNHYLYMDELNILFLHKKDLWGTFL